MKFKICAIWMIVTLLIGSFTLTNAAAAQSDWGDAYETLLALDMLPLDWKTDFDAEAVISRGEFSKALAKVLYGQEVDEKVAGEMLMQAEILAQAEDLRLGNGILFEEAVKMVVVAVGGDVIAAEYGGYPYGHISVAAERDLTTAVAGNEDGKITFGDAVALLYNLLDAQTVAQTYGENVSYVWGNETVLEVYRNIYKENGRMTANGITALDNPDYHEPNRIIIGGTSYFTDDCTSYENLIGLNVIAYYRKDGGEKTLVAAVKDGRTISEVTVAADLVERVSDTTLEYYENEEADRLKKITFDPTMKVVYNRKAVKSYTPALFEYGTGSMTFVDYNGNGTYDIARVTEYENFIVDRISASAKTVYNRFTYDDATKNIELDENSGEYTFTIEKNGAKIGFESIPVGSVLSIAKSASTTNNVIRILVSEDKTDSVLTLDKGNGKVTIDETDYKISDEYYKENKKGGKWGATLKVGNKYDFLLNAFGELVGVKMNKSDDEYYAYLFAVADGSGVFDEKYLIQILNEEGDWVDKELAEKVKYNNGDTAIGAKECMDKLTPGGTVERQLIRVKENGDGLISELKTATVTDAVDENLLTKGANRRNKYFPGNRSMQGVVYIDTDTVVFQIPALDATAEIKNNQEYYGVVPLDGVWYNYVPYDMNEFYVAKAVTLLNTSAKGMERDVMLVKEKYQTLNSEGNLVTQISGKYDVFDTMTFASPVGSDSLADVAVGDFIIVYTNAKGEVTGYDELYKVSSGKTYSQTTNQGNWGATQWDRGIVEAVDPEAGFMKVSIAPNQTFAMRIPSISVTLYDVNKETFEVIDAASVEPGDLVVFEMRYYNIGEMTAYRFEN